MELINVKKETVIDNGLECVEMLLSKNYHFHSFFLMLPMFEVIGSLTQDKVKIINGGKEKSISSADLFIYGFYRIFKNEIRLELDLNKKDISEDTFNTILQGYSIYKGIRNSLLHSLAINSIQEEGINFCKNINYPNASKKHLINVYLRDEESDFSESPNKIFLGAKNTLESIKNCLLTISNEQISTVSFSVSGLPSASGFSSSIVSSIDTAK